MKSILLAFLGINLYAQIGAGNGISGPPPGPLPGTPVESYGANPNNTAAANTTAIQNALNAGGQLTLTNPGTYSINNTLVIKSNTWLRVGSSVTIQEAANTNLQMLVTNGYNTASTTFAITSLTWSAGVSVVALCTAVCNPVIGSYVWIQGASPTMFNGIFKINATSDTSHFTFNVMRQPSTTASGTILGKFTDVNISVEGGIWDYNSNSGTNQTADAMILGVVQNLTVRNLTMKNGTKFLLEVAAARDVAIDSITSPVTNSDIVKLYGPLQRVRATNIHGTSGDDAISVQTKEAAAFSGQMWTFGDINDVVIDGVDAESTSGTAQVAVYPSANEFMSGITIRNVSGTGLYPVAVSPSYASSLLNDLLIENVTANGTGILIGAGSFTGTFTNIDIRNYSFNPSGTTNNAVNLVASNTINKLTVDGLVSNESAGDTSAVYLISISGTIDEMNVRNATVRYNQRFCNFTATATVTKANFQHITQTVGDNFLVVTSGAAGQLMVSITDSQIKTTAVFNTNVASTLKAGGNIFDSATNGVARVTGSIAVTLVDDGDNVLINGSVWEATVSGSPTITTGNWNTNGAPSFTDLVYVVPLGACGLNAAVGAFAAAAASVGINPGVTQSATGNWVLQGATTAATNTLRLFCDIAPPLRTTANKGVTVKTVDVFYGVQTTALTSIAAATLNTNTYPAAGGSAGDTVSGAGGVLTVTPASLQLPTTTNGQCYHEDISLGTPALLNTDSQRLVLEQGFSQSAAAATNLQICAVLVHYTLVPF